MTAESREAIASYFDPQNDDSEQRRTSRSSLVSKTKRSVLLTKPNELTNRWRQHFESISNVEFAHPQIKQLRSMLRPMPQINKDEVAEAVKRVKNGRATGPNNDIVF